MLEQIVNKVQYLTFLSSQLFSRHISNNSLTKPPIFLNSLSQAASGASAEEIAAALKENFAKAMAADPAAAADIARAMAVALAGAGASAEDIAR